MRLVNEFEQKRTAICDFCDSYIEGGKGCFIDLNMMEFILISLK